MRAMKNNIILIPESIYRISAISTVMSGNNFANQDHPEPYVHVRLKLKKGIYDFLREEGLNANVVVNRLLENFVVAYSAFWKSQQLRKCSGRDLNPGHGIESKGINAELAEIIDYKAVRDAFVEWLSSRVEQETLNNYIRYLDRILTEPVSSPQDLQRLINGTASKKWFAAAFRNLLTFYEEVLGADPTFISSLRRVCKVERSKPRAVFITDTELKEAYETVMLRGDDAAVLFKLMVYSGVRLTQLLRLLADFEPENLTIIEEKQIARYPIISVSKGHKKGFFAYMPADFAPQLKKIRLSYSYAKELIRHGRVSANTIRKWHYNFLIQNDVPVEVADFIQGRSPASVGAMHYLAAARQADSFYSQVVDKFEVI